MTELLIKWFVKNAEDTQNAQVRKRYGILAGVVGIVLNVLLCAAKFVIGIWSGSIAIRADAVNNLSDAGSSVVTLIGFQAAGRPADKQHPYGHARLEYIAALIIAFIILIVGVDLGRESIRKILEPQPVDFSPVTMAVLAASILVKLWMGRFTNNIGKRIRSTAMTATTMDSFCDMIATGAILLSTIIGYYFHINLDGYAGVLVALFVLYAGVDIIHDTISPLMGEAPDPELSRTLRDKLLSVEGITGVHDIMLHSYGPGMIIASAHAEVPAERDIMQIHETLDRAERMVGHELNVILTLHLDPVETDNRALNEAKKTVEGVIAELAPEVRFHDFRMLPGDRRSNLLFDIVVPPEMKRDDIDKLRHTIRQKTKEKNKSYHCVIDVDLDYTGRL